MRFFLAGLFILAGGLGIAEAQTRIDGIKIVERGYMELTESKTINDSSISTGQRTEATATLIKSADRIELAENTVFGFFFILHGQPRETNVKTRVIWRYPDPGIKAADKMKFSDEYDTDFQLNDKQWLYWNIGEIWREVPTGIWTCELWYGDRRLTRQDFEVVRN
jgi:hypothetical protein